jgi:hypothetical protein
VFNDGGGTQLYAGGYFTSAGGAPAACLARWNGSAWSAVATTMTDPGPSGSHGIAALAVFDDGTGNALYAGGTFQTIDGVAASNIAKWNGSSWQSLASGVSKNVNALAVFDDGSGPALFVGGAFQSAGGTPANFIAKWDGTSWTPLGSGLFGGPFAMKVYDDGTGPALYVAGNFSSAGGVPALDIARWDGTSWSAVGSGSNGQIYSLGVFDDGNGPELYAGGLFTLIGGVTTAHVAKWNGTSWSALGAGVEQKVSAFASFDGVGTGDALYIAGRFQYANGVEARRIASWKNGSWARVGDGNGSNSSYNNPNSVNTLATFDDGNGTALYAGGEFMETGGVTTNNVAKWNGTSWSSIGGASHAVSTLAVHTDANGTALYAGGGFTLAGGTTVNKVARFDGSNWTAVGSGINLGVLALASVNDGTGTWLFATGTFTTAGAGSASNIARFDGTNWQPLGAGVAGSGGEGGGYGACIAEFDDGTGPALYVGGTLSTAGGNPVNNIARWDGSSWSPLASGANNTVTCLIAFDDGSGRALYAGGWFSNAGGVPGTAYVARWNGTSWSPLAGGANQPVYTLRVFDDGSGPALYAGGTFTTIGGVPAKRVAKWNGTSWSALGAGAGTGLSSDAVKALAVLDDGNGRALYLGGRFLQAGGLESVNVAAWRGCGGTGTLVCSGDGVAVACPCSNSGGTGLGCQNSAGTGGARLVATGETIPDTVRLQATGELPNAPTIFLQGSVTLPTSVVFGDGVRCAGGILKRLYVKNAVAGAVTAPIGAEPSITARSAALGDTILPGSSRTYQTYYRDPDPSFCPSPTGNTFNASNGLRIDW